MSRLYQRKFKSADEWVDCTASEYSEEDPIYDYRIDRHQERANAINEILKDNGYAVVIDRATAKELLYKALYRYKV